jgi:hypothetical protein
MAPAKEPVPAEPESPPPLPNPAPDESKPNYRAIGILAVAIIAIIIGIVLLANFTSGPSGVPQENTTVIKITTLATTPPTPNPTTRTPQVTTLVTSAPTQLMIPPTGVWVRVSYPGTFTGLIGTPGNQREVTGTGDTFYPIYTNDGIVTSNCQKQDGSGDRLFLEIYKNGQILKRGSTNIPNGSVEVQMDLKTLPGAGNATP